MAVGKVLEGGGSLSFSAASGPYLQPFLKFGGAAAAAIVVVFVGLGLLCSCHLYVGKRRLISMRINFRYVSLCSILFFCFCSEIPQGPDPLINL